MRQIISIFMFAMLFCPWHCCHADGSQRAQLEWLTNYEAAVNQAKSENKPILLFFTGSDWCGWCNKLEEEVLDTRDFVDAAGNKFIFVKLDYPLYKALDSKLTAQNKELKKKYDVRSFPTIILLNASDQQQMGITGYRPGGGKQYAAHLQKIVNDFMAYKDKMQNLPKQKYSSADLKKLYEKAKELSLDDDAASIVKIGMDSDDRYYFLTERFRNLADEGMIHTPEAVALKQQLRALDPNNDNHTQYEVAVIEFEAYAEEMQKEHYSPDLAVIPLVEYISKYGNKDKTNLWRLEMIVSQVFLDKNRLDEALKHAQASYNAAPSHVQPEIGSAIKSIQTQLASSRH